MAERERQRFPEDSEGGPPPEPGSSPNPLHRAGDNLLSAADEALRRALSGDSEAFLRENRQEGGQ